MFARKPVFTFIVVLATVLAAFSLGACSSAPAPGAAASFGSHTISEDAVTEYTQDYRVQNDLADDTAWREYLASNALTVSTWRERAIRQLADEILVDEKARELGITADEQEVAQHIDKDKDEAGISQDDEQAWADYLAAKGQTPQALREKYEFSSREQQVFKHELNFTDELRDEMCTDYIRSNLADQVVRRYSAIEFKLNDKARAQRCLDKLEKSGGSSLVDAFADEAEKASTGAQTTIEDSDIGWDFVYDEDVIDPRLKLRKAKLQPGKLYGALLKGDDAYRVVFCTERVELEDVEYSSLKSDSLRDVISNLAMASSWTAQCMEYLSGLEEAANIQVTNMPDGLPYDVDSTAAQ